MTKQAPDRSSQELQPHIQQPVNMLGTCPVSFDNPYVKAITSDQRNDHKMEISSPQSYQMKTAQPSSTPKTKKSLCNLKSQQ